MYGLELGGIQGAHKVEGVLAEIVSLSGLDFPDNNNG